MNTTPRNAYAEYFLNYAEKELGKDNQYTRAIAELYDLWKNTSSMSRELLELGVDALYWQGMEEKAITGDEPEEEEEEYNEPDDLEEGFNPYIGGYDFDC